MPTFCRHNRFLADCPICAKGTVLDPDRQSQRRPRTPATTRPGSASQRRSGAAATPGAQASRGPFVSAGPYDGSEIRLERVPGGLRIAAWRGGQIERSAPAIDAGDVPALIAAAIEKGLLDAGAATVPEPEGGPPAAEPGVFGANPGRSGELQDELRVERLDAGRVRIARWVLRPNRGWELQQAPVMLPPQRFALALAAAHAKGVLASGSPAPARPS